MGLILNRGNRQERYYGIASPLDLVPKRTPSGAMLPHVNNDTALNNSGVWAAVRLRADLISTMPISAYTIATDTNNVVRKLPTSLSPFMASPDFMEWLYSSQVELDRSGNAIGIITETYGANGYPANIDLVPTAGVTMVMQDGKLIYRINNIDYSPEEIWHEKAYTVAGLPFGLSPVGHAAYKLGQYKSIEEFATNWFLASGEPRATLKNTAKKLNQKEAAVTKESWRAAKSAGDIFVHGADWQFELIKADQSAAQWIDNMRFSLEDIARFFNVPSDLIGAAVSGQSVTYANIGQRNTQFLIMHLGPTVIRRENALGKLLPRPRLVSIDTNALLRLDPEAQANTIRTMVESRQLAPSEARAIVNRPPFTEDQIKEFDELGLNRRGSTPGTSLAPVPVDPASVDAEYAPGEASGTTSGEPNSGGNS